MAKDKAKKRAVKKVEKAVRKAVKKGVTEGAVDKAVSLGMANDVKKKLPISTAGNSHRPRLGPDEPSPANLRTHT